MAQMNEMQAASYARQVDKALMASVGVAYSFIQKDLESSPLSLPLDQAVSHDMSPSDFAERVRNNFGLRGSDEPDAVPFNRRLAALVEFSAENKEWSFGRDGAIYREGPEGIERLSPARDVSGSRFGFSASMAADGSLTTRDGKVVGLEGNFEPVAGAIDIGDALDGLEARYGLNGGMRM